MRQTSPRIGKSGFCALTWISVVPTDLHGSTTATAEIVPSRGTIRQGYAMMNGNYMGFGGIWMVVTGVLVVLAIAALVKYLRK
jgi:type IV secretory pathway VirB2 component (pilin)